MTAEENKEAFKHKAIYEINNWSFPFIQAMPQKEFILANEMRKKFDNFKREMLKTIEEL